MGSVLPSLTHTQQQREATETSGDLVDSKLVQKRKAAHKSLKRWFKCDTTVAHWSLWELSDLFSHWVLRRCRLGQDCSSASSWRCWGSVPTYPDQGKDVQAPTAVKVQVVILPFFQNWCWKTTGRDCFLVHWFIYHMTTCCSCKNLYEAEESVHFC